MPNYARITAALLGTALAFAFSFSVDDVHAAGISQLEQWSSTTSPSSAITQTSYGKSIKITGLTTGQCLTLDSSGVLTTTTCGGGASFGKSWEINAAGYLAPTTTLTTLHSLGFVSQASSTVVGNFTLTGTAKVGSLNGIIKATSGTLSAATAGSDYENPLTFSWPLSRSTNAISWVGLATSSGISTSQLLYATGVNTFASVATSTLTASSPLTGSFTQIGSGGSIGCQIASGSQAGCLSSADWTTFNGKAGFGYLFPSNATTTAITFSNGASISKLTNLTQNGLVKTSGGDGTLSIDTSTYATFSYPFPSNATTTLLGLYGGASTTDASMHTLAIGKTATTTFDGTGKIVGQDVTNSFTGRISPTHRFSLGTGTTTAWTASTTNTAYSPFLVMPFTGTLKQAYCLTDASFLGVNVQVNGSNATPSYFVASSTPGVVPFTSGNTFSRGQKVLANFGTTTTSSTQEINCTFDAVETP